MKLRLEWRGRQQMYIVEYLIIDFTVKNIKDTGEWKLLQETCTLTIEVAGLPKAVEIFNSKTNRKEAAKVNCKNQ